MKKIVINLSNKLFYSVVTLGIIIMFSIIVYAYGTNNPSVLGHSSGEIQIDNVICNAVTGHNCGYDNEGSSELSCPSDMVLIPASVGHQSFCIERNERSSTTILWATKECGDDNRRLCFADQIKTAFASGVSGLNGMTNGDELIHDAADAFSYSVAYAHFIHDSNTISHNGGQALPYRCCSS